MGTRHLIAVAVDGNYKIAQYGQWDGYPSVQGLKVLNFCRSIVDQAARQSFADKCRATKFLTKEDLEALNKQINSDPSLIGGRWSMRWPELSRDAGSDILEIVRNRDAGIALKDSINFAGDSPFCEWAYVIDLDKCTLEAYKGFNQQTLDQSERFASVQPSDNYKPVRHVKTYMLDALPTDDQFMADLEPPEEE